MEDRLAPVLRALPYALRGTSTSELPFNGLGQLVLPAGLPSSLATALVPVTEPCVLFRALDLTLQRVDPHGLLQQALFSGIRDKLRSYLVLVGEIETSMLSSQAQPQTGASPGSVELPSEATHTSTPDSRTAGANTGSAAGSELGVSGGLASIQALLQSPTLYLRLFYTVVRESLDPSRNILNTLFAYAQHGDPLVARYASELHTQCYEPFKRLLRDWEDFGTLSRDVYGEFFVDRLPEERRVSRRDSYSSRQGSMHGSIDSGNDSGRALDRNTIELGHSPFRLVESRVPLPMTESEARRSFERGAALYFIREVCGDVEFDGARRTPAEISERTRSLLFADHELLLHLRGLRDYMLLANGNFVDALFRNDSTNFLMRPVSSVGSYMASEFFVSAIDDLRGLESTTVTKCVDAYILGLEAKPNSDDGKDGKASGRWRVWEAFIGKYHLDSRPLQLIVDKRAVKAYERCFASLWRVRLAIYSLSEASGTLRWLARRRDVAYLVDAHAVMNARMLEIQQLLYYGVVDHEWTQFERELQGRSSPTEIKSAHDAFIYRVAEAVASPQRTKTIQGLARVVLGLQRILEDAAAKDEHDDDEERLVAEMLASFVALAGSLDSTATWNAI